jgi:hypothetical protein
VTGQHLLIISLDGRSSHFKRDDLKEKEEIIKKKPLCLFKKFVCETKYLLILHQTDMSNVRRNLKFRTKKNFKNIPIEYRVRKSMSIIIEII